MARSPAGVDSSRCQSKTKRSRSGRKPRHRAEVHQRSPHRCWCRAMPSPACCSVAVAGRTDHRRRHRYLRTSPPNQWLGSAGKHRRYQHAGHSDGGHRSNRQSRLRQADVDNFRLRGSASLPRSPAGDTRSGPNGTGVDAVPMPVSAARLEAIRTRPTTLERQVRKSGFAGGAGRRVMLFINARSRSRPEGRPTTVDPCRRTIIARPAR